MKRKAIISTLILCLILAGAVVGVYFKYFKHPVAKTPLEAVRYLIEIKIFDKGSYDDYKSLFFDKTMAQDEKRFHEDRQKRTPKDVFPIDYDSVDSVMKHMKVKQIDENNAEVYWLKDPAKDDFSKAPKSYIVTKKGSNWYLN